MLNFGPHGLNKKPRPWPEKGRLPTVAGCVVWVACVIGGQKNAPVFYQYPGRFKTRFLTVLYRSSAHISGLSTYILNKWILPELDAWSAVLFKCFSSGNKKSFQLIRISPSDQDQQHVIREMVRSFYFSPSFVDPFFLFTCWSTIWWEKWFSSNFAKFDRAMTTVENFHRFKW